MTTVYKHLFDQAGNGGVIVSGERIVDGNARALKDLGYASVDALQSVVFSELNAEGMVPDPEWFDNTSEPFHEWRLRRADGDTLPVLAQFSRTEIGGETYLCIQWHRKDMWQKLEEKNIFQGAILRAVIDADQNLIYSKNYCDGDGIYIGCNRAFKEFYGLSETQIMGHNDLEIFGEEQGKAFRERDAHVIENRRDNLCEEWVTLPGGKRVLLHTHKTILKDGTGHIIGLLSISRDITDEHRHMMELEESEQAYKELANTDPLTGIPNRRLFFELSKKHFELTRLRNQPLSLLMIDVDDFKQINDTYGHLAGDKVLKHIVNLFRARLREKDLLARYAGDEFAVLLPDTHAEAARKTAEALQKILRETPYATVEGTEISVTLSIGVSEHRDEDICEELLQNADKALYHAKELGRNRVEVYAG